MAGADELVDEPDELDESLLELEEDELESEDEPFEAGTVDDDPERESVR